MKVRDDYIMRPVADTWAVVPVGEAAKAFNGMITLNESGALLWNTLKKGAGKEELVKALRAEYSVSEEIASADTDEFLAKLKEAGALEE